MLYFSKHVINLLSLKVSMNAASYYFHCTTRPSVVIIPGLQRFCFTGALYLPRSHDGRWVPTVAAALRGSVRWGSLTPSATRLALGHRPSLRPPRGGQDALPPLPGLHSTGEDVPETSRIFVLSFKNFLEAMFQTGGFTSGFTFLVLPKVFHGPKSRFLWVCWRL